MREAPDNLTIGQVAQQADVGVETIRFYQRKRLLGEPARERGSVRRYGRDAVARVRFIKSSQRLGFSLDEVAVLLRLEDGTHCNDARALAEGKLVEVRSKLADLRRIDRALATLVARCDKHRGNICCPMIAALQTGARGRNPA